MLHTTREGLLAVTTPPSEISAPLHKESSPPRQEKRPQMVKGATVAMGAMAGVLTATIAGPAQALADPMAPISTAATDPALMRGVLLSIEAQLADQSRRLADQDRRLTLQQARIDLLEAERDTTLGAMRATGAPPAILALAAQVPPNAVSERRLPPGPVGEAPALPEPAQDVAALPANVGVLTPPGRLVLDPSLEYVRTSNNRLVFRGVEVVPGIQLGLIEASEVARDTAVATLSARYGVTGRFEIEARAPYVYRHDRLTLLAQTDPEFDTERDIHEHSLGDVEFAARYQINSGRGGWPILVANARVKTPSGISPYDVAYDEFGVAMELATGSGFWGVEGGLTMLYPSDPAIVFGGLTYLHSIPRDIDKQIGPALVGRVAPGDSIGAQLGFGLSLNPRFSVSFGYSHNYIFPTKSEIGATAQQSRSLVAGSLQMGWSFRLLEKLTLNNSFEFGVTSDAPDMRVVLRAPYRF